MMSTNQTTSSNQLPSMGQHQIYHQMGQQTATNNLDNFSPKHFNNSSSTNNTSNNSKVTSSSQVRSQLPCDGIIFGDSRWEEFEKIRQIIAVLWMKLKVWWSLVNKVSNMKYFWAKQIPGSLKNSKNFINKKFLRWNNFYEKFSLWTF